MGVSLIPELALTSRSARTSSSARCPRPRPSRRIVAATLAGGYRSAAAAAMLDVLVEVGATHENGTAELALAV